VARSLKKQMRMNQATKWKMWITSGEEVAAGME